MPRAREAALNAIELDETLPEAHEAMAVVKWYGDWDWAGAEREFKRALQISYGDPMIFVNKPISLSLLILGALILAMMMLPAWRRTREVAFQE